MKKKSRGIIVFLICSFLIATSFSATSVSFSSLEIKIENNEINSDSNLEEEISHLTCEKADAKLKENRCYDVVSDNSLSEDTQEPPDVSSEKLVYPVDFERPVFEEINLLDREFTRVNILDCVLMGEVGSPTLPVKSVRLLLPQGTEISSIDVEGSAVGIDAFGEGYDLITSPVVPYQEPQPLSMPALESIEMDVEVYQSALQLPGKIFEDGGVGECCGYRILTVLLSPVQYVPGTGQLQYYPHMTIEIELQKTGYVSSLFRGNSIDLERVKDLVINPGVIETYKDFPICAYSYSDGLCDPSENYEYVIITNEDLIDTVGYPYNWSDLLEHRSSYSGLACKKISVEEIDSCPAYWNEAELFNDSAAHIREFIKDAYQYWGTQHVLLGGDWDVNEPSKQIVPERTFVDYNAKEDELLFYYMPCDLYYSNLNGDWYSEEHSCWGGGKGSSANDPFAEVYVGRLTVDNATQVSNIVKKIIWYDLYSDYDFNRKAVFFGGNLGWPGITSADYMDEIRNGTDPHGYQCKGFLEWNEEKPLQAFDISQRRYYDWGDSIPGDYKTLINNDNACIINHLSHGHKTKALDMYISELQGLTNSKYFFAYSQGCLCGRFFARDTTEKILLCDSSDNGAFAVVFNTGYGWGNGGSTNGASQFLHRHFWHYMFDVPTHGDQWMMGAAQAYSKDEISAYININSFHFCYAYVFYSAHLFGDPAQTIKAGLPEHDIGVKTLDVPRYVLPDEMVYVNATIFNNGANNESNVLVSFRVDGLEMDTITVSLFERQTTQQICFPWTPSCGWYTVAINVTIPDVIEEYYLDNEKDAIVIAGPDVAVTSMAVSSPSHYTDQVIDINITIENLGIVDVSDVHIYLLIDEEVTNETVVSSLVSGETAIVSFGWIPQCSKWYNVFVAVDPVIDESYTTNNYCDTSVFAYRTLYVDDDGSADFKTIQEAVDFAVDGCTIYVYNGTYYENVVVDKTMNLIGEDRVTTIIDSDGGHTTVKITADRVNITGFTIQNGNFGIYVNNGDFNNISKNNISNNEHSGILLSFSYNNIVTENIISNNGAYGLCIEGGLNADNKIYHNNFINNQGGNAIGSYSLGNIWDNGYPGGGNYWDDHDGPIFDDFSGANQNITGSDRIIDLGSPDGGLNPYDKMGGDNQDRYPFMHPNGWNRIPPPEKRKAPAPPR